MEIKRYIDRYEIENGVMFEEHKQHYKDEGYYLYNISVKMGMSRTIITESYISLKGEAGVNFITHYTK